MVAWNMKFRADYSITNGNVKLRVTEWKFSIGSYREHLGKTLGSRWRTGQRTKAFISGSGFQGKWRKWKNGGNCT